MASDSRTSITDSDQSFEFHDRRTRRECQFCERPVHWMYTRFGSKMPFDVELLPRSLDPEETGWIPGRWDVNGRVRLVMAPMSHYGRMKLARVSHVAIVHRCPQYIAFQRESA